MTDDRKTPTDAYVAPEPPALDVMSGEFFDVEIAHRMGGLPPDGLSYLRGRYVDDVSRNDEAAAQVTDWWLACHTPRSDANDDSGASGGSDA